jgi:hypothetical protein
MMNLRFPIEISASFAVLSTWTENEETLDLGRGFFPNTCVKSSDDFVVLFEVSRIREPFMTSGCVDS